jgi:hypothetical protein
LKCAGIAPFLLGAIGFYLEDAIALFFRKCDRLISSFYPLPTHSNMTGMCDRKFSKSLSVVKML